MDVLVIGGTQFVGRALVEAALARGHSLTLFHRGRTNARLFPDVEEILGDRDGGLPALDGRRWDVVVDTCGYVPRVVRASVDALADRVGSYAFVSTISVYRDPRPGTDENGELGELEDPDVEEVNAKTYGPLKVACERVVTDRLGPRSLVIRPGVIVGPHDPTDRFTYWPVRFARGGRVVVPANGDAPVQFVDARDLADWTVGALEAGLSGPFNIVGPREPWTMGRFLDACRDEMAPPGTELVPIPDDFLLAHGVTPFTGLPFWLPPPRESGLLAVRHDRALATGLAHRPLPGILRDTLAWHRERGEPPLSNGLPADTEAAILDAWAKRPAGDRV